MNGPKSTIKEHRLRKQIGKQDPDFCCRQETNSTSKTDINYLKVKDQEKVFQLNVPKRQEGEPVKKLD